MRRSLRSDEDRAECCAYLLGPRGVRQALQSGRCEPRHCSCKTILRSATPQRPCVHTMRARRLLAALAVAALAALSGRILARRAALVDPRPPRDGAAQQQRSAARLEAFVGAAKARGRHLRVGFADGTASATQAALDQGHMQPKGARDRRIARGEALPQGWLSRDTFGVALSRRVPRAPWPSQRKQTRRGRRAHLNILCGPSIPREARAVARAAGTPLPCDRWHVRSHSARARYLGGLSCHF